MTISETQPRAWWEEVAHLRRDRAAGGSGSPVADDLLGAPMTGELAGAPRARRPMLASDVGEDPLSALGTQIAGRRTVQIRGQVIPTVPARRLVEVQQRRRHTRSPVERVVARPDRIALYAFVFAVLLVLIAATSSHA